MSRSRLYTFLCFVIVFAVQGATQKASITKPFTGRYVRPLGFEPNRGQMHEPFDFVAQSSGYRLLLSRGEVLIMLPGMTAPVRMKPMGANPAAGVPIEELYGKSNYFIGNIPARWRTDIPTYAKIRYSEVYPAIDLLYYGNQRQLEYDFVIKAAGDPSRISFQFEGPTNVSVDRSGDLVMHTDAGEVRWRKPVAYQEVKDHRKFIDCGYAQSDDGAVTFRLSAYDRTKTLVIDPVLVYSTYLGGSGNSNSSCILGIFAGACADQANAIVVDSAGNAYITGSTASPDFPVTGGTFEPLYPGYYFATTSAFVSKFNAAGELVYSTYLGGSDADLGTGVAVDSEGNAFVTGQANSLDFPIKNAFQSSNRSGSAGNAFVTKLNAEGNALVYSTYLGGSNNDAASAVAIDHNGNAYVTGFTTSLDFPTNNALQTKLKSTCSNAFVTKLDAGGNKVMYSTYLGGSGCGLVQARQPVAQLGDVGNGIAVDRSGNAYITGATLSADFPVRNAFQAHLQGTCGTDCANAFVTKLGATGNTLDYSTYLAGSGQPAGYGSGTSGNAIVVDAAANAYVAGYTNSADFPTKNPFEGTLKNPNQTTAFVTKFEAAGTTLGYSTYLGGSAVDAAFGIALDTKGNAYVTGSTASTDFPIKNAFQGVIGCKPDQSCQNAFVTKFDSAGSALVYSSYLGGSDPSNVSYQADSGYGIAVDGHGNAYVTGVTVAPDFPTKNAFQSTLNNPTGSAFVTKISAK